MSSNEFQVLSVSLRCIFFLVLVFLFTGILDQIKADGQIFTNPSIMLNIIVRSVALGIVAVGQTLVLDRCFHRSICSIYDQYHCSHVLIYHAGRYRECPDCPCRCIPDRDDDRFGQWIDHYQTSCQSFHCDFGYKPDHQRYYQCYLLKLYRQRSRVL